MLALLGLVAAAAGASAFAPRIAARVRVMGPSMAPTLLDGDRVLVNFLAYALHRPRAGDVVLAHVAGVPGGWTIKRIGGLPGRDGPSGSMGYYLLGDNAAASTDSRTFGAVPRRAIRGRVWFRYWPSERRGPLT